MREKLKQSIREKEMQMKKLAPLIDKNPVCSNLFNKVNNDTFFKKVKRFLPKNQTLICDYFK